MVKKHIGMSNAERCRAYRKRQKLKIDNIEKQLNDHIKELKNADKEQKTEKKFNVVDSLIKSEKNTLEPQRELRKQYQISDKNEYGFNAWNTTVNDNPLDKVSHQQNLKNIFGNRAE
jgi:hypothetical protein